MLVSFYPAAAKNLCSYMDKFFKSRAAYSTVPSLSLIHILFDGTKPTAADRQMIRKMVSFGVVKKSGDAGLWLDEGKVSNPGNVLRQRLLIILAALILAVAYCWFMGDFIF